MAKRTTTTTTTKGINWADPEQRIEVTCWADRKSRPYRATVRLRPGQYYSTVGYATHAAAREAGIALARTLGIKGDLAVYGTLPITRC